MTNLFLICCAVWLTNVTGSNALAYYDGSTNCTGGWTASICYSAQLDIVCPSNLTGQVQLNYRPQDPTPWYSGAHLIGWYGMEWENITPPLNFSAGTNHLLLAIPPGENWFFRVKKL